MFFTNHEARTGPLGCRREYQGELSLLWYTLGLKILPFTSIERVWFANMSIFIEIKLSNSPHYALGINSCPRVQFNAQRTIRKTLRVDGFSHLLLLLLLPCLTLINHTFSYLKIVLIVRIFNFDNIIIVI